MNEQARAALEESIAHWERMVEGSYSPGERPSSGDCALCRAFRDKDCNGCPVKMWTGELDCGDTPYDSEDIWGLYEDQGLDSEEFKAAARKELEFLKSLRE